MHTYGSRSLYTGTMAGLPGLEKAVLVLRWLCCKAGHSDSTEYPTNAFGMLEFACLKCGLKCALSV